MVIRVRKEGRKEGEEGNKVSKEGEEGRKEGEEGEEGR
jgi:hypothetical protein